MILGYYGGQLSCAANCQSFNEADCAGVGRCGDGVIQPEHEEECDGSDLDAQSCHPPGLLLCTPECRFDYSNCDARCGDGIVQGSFEDCDGTNLDGQTCQSLGHLFGGGLSCDGQCRFVRNCIDVLAIAVGGEHTCAVLGDGTARCWGRNNFGQLGDDTMVPRGTPVAVSRLTGAQALFSGSFHTCAAVDSQKHIKCWGLNGNGQLGDGTATNRHTPVYVTE